MDGGCKGSVKQVIASRRRGRNIRPAARVRRE